MQSVNGSVVTSGANNSASAKRASLIATWAFPLYLSLVIYGSLIPFDVRELTLVERWQQFLRIPYLELGVQSRADWIANILLYIPLSYFAVAWLQRYPIFRRIPLTTIAFVLFGCTAIAVGIEFTQIFFAPRTVSINDLIAEVIGAAIGIALRFTTSRYLAPSWQRLALGGRQALVAALGFYTLTYIILSLFPFDFLLSFKEVSWKLTTDSFGLLLAPAFAGDWLRAAVRLVAEIGVTAPLGLFAGLLFNTAPHQRVTTAIKYGLLLGIVFGLFLQPGVRGGSAESQVWMPVNRMLAGVLIGLAIGVYLDVCCSDEPKPEA